MDESQSSLLAEHPIIVQPTLSSVTLSFLCNEMSVTRAGGALARGELAGKTNTILVQGGYCSGLAKEGVLSGSLTPYSYWAQLAPIPCLH